MKKLRIALALCLLLTGCAPETPSGSAPPEASSALPPVSSSLSPQPEDPQPQAEFKGVWVSYIELNALLKDATPAGAKAALDDMMDNCVSYGMNAVVFHVRANSDAYYASKLFQPAAAAAPLLEDGFDPLAHAVEAAHARCLELHAWINPYRLGRNPDYRAADIEDYFADESGSSPVYWYVPTSAAVQKKILDGVREIVDNYAVDGIQYDDYFYPHGILPADEPASCEKADYEASGGSLTVGDWRRTGVDALIAGTYRAAHRRAGCVFGVSPSHDYEKTREQGYADTVKWLETAGYVDYLCPQIYFGFSHASSAFDGQVALWESFSPAAGVRLYVGLGIYKAGISPDRWAGASGRTEWAGEGDVLERSVELLRRQNHVSGMLFYSYSFFEPDTPRSLDSWTEDGKTVAQTYDREAAAREVENLLPLLREGEA